jgi:hypothetical protein
MTDSFWQIMYSSIYASPIAVDAELITAGGDSYAVRAVDKTVAASMLGMGGIEFNSFRPTAMMRVPDIGALGIDIGADLYKGQLIMNGRTWLIKSFEYAPSPTGIADGELRVILQDAGNV